MWLCCTLYSSYRNVCEFAYRCIKFFKVIKINGKSLHINTDSHHLCHYCCGDISLGGKSDQYDDLERQGSNILFEEDDETTSNNKKRAIGITKQGRLIVELDFIAAFMIGLLGSGHCIGMCGGMGLPSLLVSIKPTINAAIFIYYYTILAA